MFSKTILVSSLVAAVSAHQNFHQFWVNDVSPGYQASIRMPPSNSPVTDVTSNDITCNVNGNNVPSGVSTTAANEGDSIKVQWDSSTHPGPIAHFLFGPVTNASMATGVGSWVKIDEFDQVNGTWANEIMEAQDMTYTFKLPTGLASGDYLLRSEMLALHGSQTIGGAQFYIGCAQLTITGTAGDSCTPEIQLPGAYSATDPGIYIPNVYNGFDIKNYTAPGGAVATCGAGSGSGSSAVATSAVLTSSVAVSTSAVVSSTAAVVETSASASVAISSSAAASVSSVAPTTTAIASSSAAPTTLQTVAVTAIAASTSSAASPSTTAVVNASAAPSGTTLANLLAWISSFYSANKGAEYTGETTA